MVYGEGIADVAAADVEETDAGFQLFGDGEVLAFGSPRHRFDARTGVMRAGNSDACDTGVVGDTGHPAVHDGQRGDGQCRRGLGFRKYPGLGGLLVFTTMCEEKGNSRNLDGLQSGCNAHNVNVGLKRVILSLLSGACALC